MAGRAFASGDLDTGLIERERDALFPPAAKPPREVLLVAALATLLRETKAGPAKIRAGRDTFSPWSRRDNWRLNATELRTLTFRSGETEFSLQVKNADRGWQLTLDGVANQAQGVLGANDSLRAEIDGQAIEAAVVAAREKRHIFLRGHGYLLVQVDALHHAGQAEGAEDGLVAPIPGRIVALLATPGVPVAKGTPLLILEAMKMELSILAPAAGVVAAFHFAAGASVTEGVPLLAFEPTK